VEPTGSLDAERVVLRGTVGEAAIRSSGGRTDLRAVVVDETTGAGILATDGTVLSATDLVVRRGEPDAGGLGGWGLQLWSGANATIERAAIEDDYGAGIQVVDAATSLVLSRSVVRRTQLHPSFPASGGHGLDVRAGARATLDRVWLDGNHEAGIRALEGDGSTVGVTDSVISGTQPVALDVMGFGVFVGSDSTVTLERVSVLQNHGVGIEVDVGHLEATDVTVRRTQSTRHDEFDRDDGYGVEMRLGARADGTRVSIEEVHRGGIVAFDVGTSAVFRDVSIADTLPRECVVDECAGVGGGVGVSARGGASVDLTTLFVARSALVGVQVADEGEIDLHDGSVSQSPFGVNVQVDGYDLNRLRDGVYYIDVDVPVDGSALPLPEPAATF
jgi:hypothetical protein